MEIYSFVIPCYRSENTIEKVVQEIRQTMSLCERPSDYEIIAVNDCSPDGVFEVLKRMAKEDHKIKVIDFARNMGKHAAVMAGYSVAAGDYIVNLDDDYQSPVYALWDFVKKLDEGYDVVMADYPEKKESAFKSLGSRVNSLMIRILLEKPKELTYENFSIMKSFVAKEMVRYKNPYPYLEGLMLRTTRNIARVTVEERERGDDKTTGYTFRKSLALMINGLTAFSVKPLRVAFVTGISLALIGFVFGIVTIVRRIMNINYVLGYSSLMAVLLFIGGVIMIMLGLLGEYIGRIYICLNSSPQYVIRSTINCEAKEDV